MIIQLMMNKEDIRASCITYSFLQTDCRRKIATASRNWGEPVRLYVEGDTIEFAAMPAFVDRLSLRLPYPESLKGKQAIGYSTGENNCLFLRQCDDVREKRPIQTQYRTDNLREWRDTVRIGKSGILWGECALLLPLRRLLEYSGHHRKAYWR